MPWQVKQEITFYRVPERHHRKRLDNNTGTRMQNCPKLRIRIKASSVARILGSTKSDIIIKPRYLKTIVPENMENVNRKMKIYQLIYSRTISKSHTIKYNINADYWILIFTNYVLYVNYVHMWIKMLVNSFIQLRFRNVIKKIWFQTLFKTIEASDTSYVQR